MLLSLLMSERYSIPLLIFYSNLSPGEGDEIETAVFLCLSIFARYYPKVQRRT
jgi:hypothetical protein